jgi:mono/diheme cytochrome c family protein
LSPCHLVIFSLTLAVGCDLPLPGRPDRKDRPVPADEVLSFDRLFGENCAGCHGADGKLGPAPPLNDALFRALVPEKTVESVVSSGRPGTLMPAFAQAQGGTLTADQVRVLVLEIKGIPYRIVKKCEGEARKVEVVRDANGPAPKWGLPGPAPGGAPPYPAGDRSGDAGRGRKVFARACANCHGEHGQGTKGGDSPVGAVNDPAFLALVSDQALRRLAITGRPDLGMPNFASDNGRNPDFKPLTSEEITDLVALLASWRHGETAPGK